MHEIIYHRGWIKVLTFAALCFAGLGCCSVPGAPMPAVVPCDVPRELGKVTLPPYRIEPPTSSITDPSAEGGTSITRYSIGS